MPSVIIDPNQLDQIIVNLVVNSKDAMPGGGTLTISTEFTKSDNSGDLAHPPTAAGDYVVLGVSDTGVGIADEARAHLCEPFFTAKETGMGTDLGLAACYGIAEQNGSHIEVHSELSNGSVFGVYLPATAEHAEPDVDKHR